MTEPTSSTRTERWWVRLIGAGIVAVIGVVPLVLDRDSYPLSTYPMFSSRRTSIEPVHTAVLVDSDGTIDRLSPTQISGNDEVIIAAQLVYESIGHDGGVILCDDIARRIGGANTEGSTVEIVTERFDAIDWYEGRRSPISRVVHATCRVSGVDS
jgi:hypothetical protein